MEAGFGRAKVEPEAHRYLRQRHPQVVVEHDDRAPIRREVLHCLVEKVAIDDVAAEVADDRRVIRHQLDLNRASLPTPGEIETRIDEQPMEPGVEPVRVAQRGQVPPGPDHRILDRVPREVVVPEDQSCGRIQARDRPIGKHGEGVMIASLRSLDETSLVHGRLGLPLAQSR